MKSSNQGINLFQQITAKKIHYSDLYKNNSNNNRKEIFQQMKKSTHLATSVSQKHLFGSFRDRCVQNQHPTSILIAKPPGMQCLKQFPKINNSYCYPQLLQLLEFYNGKPKEEKLLKGQNQLILERKQLKYVSEMKDCKKRMPSIQINTKEMSCLNRKRIYRHNCKGIGSSESFDTDRMELNFECEGNDDDIVNNNDDTHIETNDEISISPSRKYDKILSQSRKTLLGYQYKQKYLSDTDLINTNKNNSTNNDNDNDNSKSNSGFINYESNRSNNIVNQVNKIIKAYDSNSNHKSDKNESNKKIKHNQSFSNLITSLSNSVNTTQCSPLMKQFTNGSCQTNLFMNNHCKFKPIKKSHSKSKSKSILRMESHSSSIKQPKKKHYGSQLPSSFSTPTNTLLTNPYGLGIIFHSSNKFSYVIQLNNINEWRHHEEEWDNVALNKDLAEDSEYYLLPPNMKDTLISAFFYLKGKTKKRKNSETNKKASLNDCFIYNLDHVHVKDFKHESLKWNNAFQRIADRWNQDQVASLFLSKTMNEEIRLKIKKEAPIIVDYAQGLYQNIIDLLIEIFRHKLKKKLED